MAPLRKIVFQKRLANHCDTIVWILPWDIWSSYPGYILLVPIYDWQLIELRIVDIAAKSPVILHAGPHDCFLRLCPLRSKEAFSQLMTLWLPVFQQRCNNWACNLSKNIELQVSGQCGARSLRYQKLKMQISVGLVPSKPFRHYTSLTLP